MGKHSLISESPTGCNVSRVYHINRMTATNEYSFHPFIHSFSNHRSRRDLLAPASIPDVVPSDLGDSKGDFSFAAGDFVEIYGGGRQTGKASHSFARGRYINDAITIFQLSGTVLSRASL